MQKMRSVLLAATVLLAVGMILHPTTGWAHPPWRPYDQTVFAPIKAFGPRIKVLTIHRFDPAAGAINLTSPLKGVAAPGLPNHLFIVDQVGKIVAINLAAGNTKVVFHDVSALLVPLGVIGGLGCSPPIPPGTEPSFDERGLLGLAFHPNYRQNGKFYTYTSEPAGPPPTIPSAVAFVPDHQNVISEWTASNPANPAAGVNPVRRVLMRVDWPQFNHDGGDLAFGRDGLLYISMGDGGGADDQDGQMFIVTGTCGTEAPMTGHGPNGNGQNKASPLGKIHRIDVNPPFSPGKEYKVPPGNPFVGQAGAVAEIFAYGFRNPYRISFDKERGDLYLGDVGQNDIEEVNLVVKGGNYGWRRKEGTLCFDPGGFGGDSGTASPCPAPISGLIDPIAQYDTHHEGHSVIGGFVYRGHQMPNLRGRYIFGEFATKFNFPTGPHDYGRILHVAAGGQHDDEDEDEDNNNRGILRRIRDFQIQGGNAIGLAVLGFGQDAAGELYVTGNHSGIPFGTDGVVVKLVPADDEPSP